MIGNDPDGGAGRDLVAESSYIDRAHSYAAVASRMAEKILLRGSMDIDPSIEGVLIARFRPLKPENACHDRITSRSIRLEHFTGGGA